MMSKVVAHFIATNFYGGPERQIINHAVRLKEHSEYKPVIISFQEGDDENELVNVAKSLGIPTLLISAQGAFNVAALKELYVLLKDYSVKLLVSHGYKANIVGRLISFLCGIPMIAVSRGWTAENFKIAQYEKIDRLFLRYASIVVAVSDGQKNKLIKHGIEKKKILTIRNAIDLSGVPKGKRNEFRKEIGITEDSILVATAGRLSIEKDQATLVEAAKEVCGKRENVFFAIFGEGPLRPMLEQKISECRLQGQFFLPGFRKNLLSMLCDVDIFVLPSLTEGLPNVILEAFAYRIPVIATRVGGTPEIVMHGENGILISPGDVVGLAESIDKLAGDCQLRAFMGRNGNQVVADRFDYTHQTENYIRLYNQLVAG